MRTIAQSCCPTEKYNFHLDMYQRGAHGGGAGGDLFAIRNENEGAIFFLSLATMLRTITFSRVSEKGLTQTFFYPHLPLTIQPGSCPGGSL